MLHQDDSHLDFIRPIRSSDYPIPDIPEPGPDVRRWVADAVSDYPEWGPCRISAYLRRILEHPVTADQVRYILAVPADA